MDSVPITLKKVVEAPPGILTDEELLIRILAEVRAIKTKRGEPVEQSELKFVHEPDAPRVCPVPAAKPKKTVKKHKEAA
jgi:hypothetical protein